MGMRAASDREMKGGMAMATLAGATVGDDTHDAFSESVHSVTRGGATIVDDGHINQRTGARRPNAATRRQVIAAAAGLLFTTGLGIGFLADDARAANGRRRGRSRNKNRSHESSTSIPGKPGEPGKAGEQ